MSDLVERLRSITSSNFLKPYDKVQIHKAADEIERLQGEAVDDAVENANLKAEIERLQETLKYSCESARYNLYDCGFTAMQLRAVDAEAEIERLNALIKADGRVIDENISEIAKLQAVVDAVGQFADGEISDTDLTQIYFAALEGGDE